MSEQPEPTATVDQSAETAATPQLSRAPAVPLLAVLALAQLALIAWLFWPQPSQAAAGKLFSAFDPALVSHITINWEEEALTLAKNGDDWVLPDRGDYPANAMQVTGFLTKVAQIDASRLVASNASSHARLRVDDRNPIRRIEMTTSDGKDFALFVGTSPNARATNVRAGGSDNVYLTSALSTGDVRVDLPAWVDTRYLSLDPATIHKLSFENASGAWTLTKDDAGVWTLPDLAAGEVVISSTVETLVRNVANLSLSDVLGAESKPEYGLEPPAATVTLEPAAASPVTDTATTTGTTVAMEPVRILIGAQDDASGSYAVKASSSPFYVRVTAATLDPFLQYTRNILVAAPVTETTPITSTERVTP